MDKQNNPNTNHIDTYGERMKKEKKEFDWFELDSRFLLYIIQNKPELHYHDNLKNNSGQEDAPKCSDEITLVWGSGDDKFGSRKVMLDKDGDAERDENGDDLGLHEAEPTVVQIAKLVALYGRPDKIHYIRFDTLWRFDEDDTQTPHEAEFDYFEFKDDILKEAYLQFPKFKDMSLAEIGNELMKIEEQESKK